MLPLLKLLRKEKKKSIDKKIIEKKGLPEMIDELEHWQTMLNLLGSNRVTEDDKEKLKKIEKEVIDLLPDEFQRKVFEILSENNFNLLEFLKQDDWREPLKSACEDIAYYLNTEHPSNFIKELPFTGKEFLLWMLQQAKLNSKKDSYEGIAKALHGQIICGHEISNETIEKIFGICLVVFVSEDYGGQFKILIKITRDIEGGEEFIQELLKDSEY